MTNRTAWTSGNGAGLNGWTTLINSADMASMSNGKTVLSSIVPITNGFGGSLDQFMDISFSLTISSSSVVAGANFAFWLYALNQDGSTYGDNQLTAGTAASLTPVFPACFTFPCVTGTQTNFTGSNGNNPIALPPGTFLVAIQNNCGFALTSGTQTVKYRTYNINLNN